MFSSASRIAVLVLYLVVLGAPPFNKIFTLPVDGEVLYFTVAGSVLGCILSFLKPTVRRMAGFMAAAGAVASEKIVRVAAHYVDVVAEAATGKAAGIAGECGRRMIAKGVLTSALGEYERGAGPSGTAGVLDPTQDDDTVSYASGVTGVSSMSFDLPREAKRISKDVCQQTIGMCEVLVHIFTTEGAYEVTDDPLIQHRGNMQRELATLNSTNELTRRYARDAFYFKWKPGHGFYDSYIFLINRLVAITGGTISTKIDSPTFRQTQMEKYITRLFPDDSVWLLALMLVHVNKEKRRKGKGLSKRKQELARISETTAEADMAKGFLGGDDRDMGASAGEEPFLTGRVANIIASVEAPTPATLKSLSTAVPNKIIQQARQAHDILQQQIVEKGIIRGVRNAAKLQRAAACLSLEELSAKIARARDMPERLSTIDPKLDMICSYIAGTIMKWLDFIAEMGGDYRRAGVYGALIIIYDALVYIVATHFSLPILGVSVGAAAVEYASQYVFHQAYSYYLGHYGVDLSVVPSMEIEPDFSFFAEWHEPSAQEWAKAAAATDASLAGASEVTTTGTIAGSVADLVRDAVATAGLVPPDATTVPDYGDALRSGTHVGEELFLAGRGIEASTSKETVSATAAFDARCGTATDALSDADVDMDDETSGHWVFHRPPPLWQPPLNTPSLVSLDCAPSALRRFIIEDAIQNSAEKLEESILPLPSSVVTGYAAERGTGAGPSCTGDSSSGRPAASSSSVSVVSSVDSVAAVALAEHRRAVEAAEAKAVAQRARVAKLRQAQLDREEARRREDAELEEQFRLATTAVESEEAAAVELKIEEELLIKSARAARSERHSSRASSSASSATGSDAAPAPPRPALVGRIMQNTIKEETPTEEPPYVEDSEALPHHVGQWHPAALRANVPAAAPKPGETPPSFHAVDLEDDNMDVDDDRTSTCADSGGTPRGHPADTIAPVDSSRTGAEPFRTGTSAQTVAVTGGDTATADAVPATTGCTSKAEPFAGTTGKVAAAKPPSHSVGAQWYREAKPPAKNRPKARSTGAHPTAKTGARPRTQCAPKYYSAEQRRQWDLMFITQG